MKKLLAIMTALSISLSSVGTVLVGAAVDGDADTPIVYEDFSGITPFAATSTPSFSGAKLGTGVRTYETNVDGTLDTTAPETLAVQDGAVTITTDATAGHYPFFRTWFTDAAQAQMRASKEIVLEMKVKTTEMSDYRMQMQLHSSNSQNLVVTLNNPISAAIGSGYTTIGGAAMSANTWTYVKIRFNFEMGMMTAYTSTDGAKWSGGGVINIHNTAANRICDLQYIGFQFHQNITAVKNCSVDYIKVYKSDVQSTYEELTLPEIATENLTLPTTGNESDTKISWTSSDANVISTTGVVTPASTEKKITLTAVIAAGGLSLAKEFVVTVPAGQGDEVVANDDINMITYADILADGVYYYSATGINSKLPDSGPNGSTITWETSNSDVINLENGTLTQPSFGSSNAKVKLTATATYNEAAVTKDFYLYVPATGYVFTKDFNHNSLEDVFADPLVTRYITGDKTTDFSVTGDAVVMCANATGTLNGILMETTADETAGGQWLEFKINRSAGSMIQLKFNNQENKEFMVFDIQNKGLSWKTATGAWSGEGSGLIAFVGAIYDTDFTIKAKFDMSQQKITELYIDDVLQEGATLPFYATAHAVSKALFYKNNNSAAGANICLKSIKMWYTDDEYIARDLNTIPTLTENADAVIENLVALPTVGTRYNSTITWTSDNEEVISNTGVVTRPIKGDAKVTLTATGELNGITATRTYVFTVLDTTSVVVTPLTLTYADGEYQASLDVRAGLQAAYKLAFAKYNEDGQLAEIALSEIITVPADTLSINKTYGFTSAELTGGQSAKVFVVAADDSITPLCKSLQAE